jgi:hypothetical protein
MSAMDLCAGDLRVEHRFTLFADIVPEYWICVVAVTLLAPYIKQYIEAEIGKLAYSLGSMSRSLVEANLAKSLIIHGRMLPLCCGRTLKTASTFC